MLYRAGSKGKCLVWTDVTDCSSEIHRWPFRIFDLHLGFIFILPMNIFLIIIYIKFVPNRLFCWIILSVCILVEHTFIFAIQPSGLRPFSCFFSSYFTRPLWGSTDWNTTSSFSLCDHFVVGAGVAQLQAVSPDNCPVPCFSNDALLYRSHQQEPCPALTQPGPSSASHWE